MFNDHDDFLAGVLAAIFIVILILVCWFATAWVAMLLWNNIMVGVFGLPALTFWQTYGIILLAHLIFPSHYSSSKKD
jgi:hypothetical protein